MVIGMVTFMSIFGLLMRPEMPQNIVSAYFIGWGMNFIAALPVAIANCRPNFMVKTSNVTKIFR